MADDGLQWLLSLDVDQEDALGFLKTLDKLSKSLGTTKTETDKVEHATKAAGEGHKKHAEHAKGLAGVLEHLMKSGLEPLGKKFEQIAEFEFIRKGVDALIELPEKIIDILKEVTEEMITTAAAAQRTNTAFELLFGKEEGRETLEYLEGISKYTEFTGAHAKEAALSLRKMGFEGEGLRRAHAAALDMAAFSGKGQEGFDSAIASLERIKRSGRVDNRSLGGLGIGEPAFFKELSARTGMAVDTLKKQIEKGKIDGEVVLETLYSMITKKTGKALGGAGVAMSETLAAKLVHLKAMPEEFFERLADSPGLGVLTDALTRVLDVINPDSPHGHAIFDALDRAFTEISGTVAGMDFDTMAENLTAVVAMMPELIAGFRTVGDVIATIAGGLTKAWEVVEMINNPFKAGSDRKKANREFVDTHQDQILVEKRLRAQLEQKRADVAAGYIQYGPAEDPSVRLERMRKDARTELAHGKATAAGLTEGLGSSALAVEKAGAALGVAATTGTARELGIHSPSKVFAELGRMSAAGFTEGVDSSISAVDAAVGQMFAAPGPAAGGAAARGGINVAPGAVVITIQVPGGSGLTAETVAEVAARAVESALPGALKSGLDQMAAQGGEN